MVYVPGGLYRRGSEDCLEQDDDVHTSELPVHLAAIAPFALAETPVTRRTFADFVADQLTRQAFAEFVADQLVRRAFAKSVADQPADLRTTAEEIGGSLVDFVADQPADLRTTAEEIGGSLADFVADQLIRRAFADSVADQSADFQTTAEELGGSFIFDRRTGYRFAQGIHWRHDAFGEAWETADMSNEAWEHPVIHVSWYDACRYANWRSVREGLAPCYRLGEVKAEIGPERYRTVVGIHGFEDTGGYRLPTEAEWEYAAGRAAPGEQQVFAGTSDADTLHDYAHYRSGEGTAPVKGRKPNALDLYDLSGNVYEWCQQAFGEYGPFLYVDHPEKEFWREGEDGAAGVVWMRPWKGGSWIYDNFMLLRVAHRYHNSPHDHDLDGGFRLARTLRS